MGQEVYQRSEQHYGSVSVDDANQHLKGATAVNKAAAGNVSGYPGTGPVVEQPPPPGLRVNSQEALNHLRKELEIERKEVDKWKKDQQQDIAEERRKIQEAQHGLLEEKIR